MTINDIFEEALAALDRPAPAAEARKALDRARDRIVTAEQAAQVREIEAALLRPAPVPAARKLLLTAIG